MGLKSLQGAVSAAGAGLEGLVGHLVYTIWQFCFLWVFYMALEPLARRFWPQMLTSWVRLFNGRSRDPLVGRDLLVGVLAGILMLSMNWLVIWGLPQLLDVAPLPPQWSDDTGLALMGGRQWIGTAAAAVNNASVFLFIPVMIVALTRLLVRKTWLAVGLCLVFFFFMLWPSPGSPVPHLIGTPLFLPRTVLLRSVSDWIPGHCGVRGDPFPGQRIANHPRSRVVVLRVVDLRPSPDRCPGPLRIQDLSATPSEGPRRFLA